MANPEELEPKICMKCGFGFEVQKKKIIIISLDDLNEEYIEQYGYVRCPKCNYRMSRPITFIEKDGVIHVSS